MLLLATEGLLRSRETCRFTGLDGICSLIHLRLDFLAGEYAGTGKAHRTQRVQEGVLAKRAAVILRSPCSSKRKSAANCPSGLDALVAEIRPSNDHGLVQEGFRKIADKFATVTHVGPKFVADFDDVQEPEERSALMRDAFDYLLRALKIR